MTKKAVNAPLKEAEEPIAEQDRLNKRVQTLEEKVDRLQKELAKTEHERDIYLKSLYALTRKEFSEEEMEEFDRASKDEEWVSGEELMAELEQLVKRS